MSSLNDETYAASLISQEDTTASPSNTFFQRYFSFTFSQVVLVLGCISLLFNASYGLFLLFNQAPSAGGGKPGNDDGVHRRVVINTWWPAPANVSMGLLLQNYSALDAVVAGCISAEENFAYGDHTVGPNGSPDTTGETTLDALLGDGSTMDYGVVSYLRRIPSAILAAKAVMTYTRHTVLSGDGATVLASAFGGQQEGSLTGNFSRGEYQSWTAAGCQPNYYAPDWVGGANTSCPPYTPRPMPSPTPLPLWLHTPQGHHALGALRKAAAPHRHLGWATPSNHDTLGICAMDASGSLAVGVTSNGANHKVAGRVGDAPIVGAGGYASNEAGCAAVTGE